MDLSVFRRKLASEISKLEEDIKCGTDAIKDFQLDIYSISALVRKIITRLPDYKKRNIEVYQSENGRDNVVVTNIELKKLVDRSIHYYYLSTGWMANGFNYFHVLSDYDKDEKIDIRNVKTQDFISIAKEIATDDKQVLKNLIQYTIPRIKSSLKYYNKNTNCSEPFPYYGSEATQALNDVFTLLREMDIKDIQSLHRVVTTNKITVYFEVLENLKEDSQVLRSKSHKMRYDDFILKTYDTLKFGFNRSLMEVYDRESGFNVVGKTVLTIYDPVIIIPGIPFANEKVFEIFKQVGLCTEREMRLLKCMVLVDDLFKLLEKLKNAC